MTDGESAVADGVMSIKEACAFSGLSKTELYDRMNGGSLKFVKHGRRRLIPKKSLVELLARGLAGGEGQTHGRG